MNRKIKSVSFNMNDHFERKMFEHIDQMPNFSTFMKRLIQNHIQSLEITTNTNVKLQPEVPTNKPQFDITLMKQFI